MRAASIQGQAEQAEPIEILDDPEAGPSVPPVGYYGHAETILRVAANWCLNDPVRGGNPPMHQGQVLLVDGPLLHLSDEPVEGTVGQCDDHETRGPPVKAVNDAGTEGISHGEARVARQEGVHQGIRRMSRGRMYNQTGGLIYDEEVRALVDDRQRHCDRHQPRRCGRGEINPNMLAGPKS